MTLHNINEQAALDLVMELMAVPGKSCEEERIAAEVLMRLQAAGIPRDDILFDEAHTKTPKPGEVGNLIARIPGTKPGPTLLLSAHLDTVPICVGCKPVRNGDYVESSDEKTGLGADNRAGVATLVTAATELLANDLPHVPVVLCFFVQEEIGLQGSRCLDPEVLGPIDLALNYDGGEVQQLIVGATGGERIEIEIEGLASHAGIAPDAGVNAATIASLAIEKLHREGWLGRVTKPEGNGTSNIGVFQGGEATNVVMPHVLIRAEARSYDSAMRTRIVQEIRSAFEWAAGEVKSNTGKTGSISFRSNVDYDSFELASDCPSVVAAEEALKAIGHEPVRQLAGGGLDANWLFKHGISAVTLGCGQRNVHTSSEQLSIADYLDGCRVAIHAAMHAAS